jgi:site-specific recombinase XerD
MRVLSTFVGCFVTPCHPEIQRLRQIRPQHVEEFKSRRAAGSIVEAPSEEERTRERDLRLELAKGAKLGSPQDKAKFGWLGHRSISPQVSQRTINYELRALFSWFHWCVKRNLLFVNPVTNVERFKLSKKALPKFMTGEELRMFFAACTPGQRRLYEAILFSGMRKGEAEWLTWNDINLQLGVIFIQAKDHGELKWTPKTDERVVPISPMLERVLIEQFASRTSETWVFANEAGNRDTHILDKLKKICRRAGIASKTVHALRHSFGAHLRMAGVSLADIADLLGHKDLATTQIYAKVHQAHLREAVGRLAGVVDENSVVATHDRDTLAVPPNNRDRKLLPS